jgi:hypothetical protein
MGTHSAQQRSQQGRHHLATVRRDTVDLAASYLTCGAGHRICGNFHRVHENACQNKIKKTQK